MGTQAFSPAEGKVKSSAVMQQPDPWRLDRNWAATVTDGQTASFTLCFLEAELEEHSLPMVRGLPRIK